MIDHTLLVYVGAVGAMFLSTFLRGFQNKNVNGGHKRLAFICGYMMTVFDVIVISLVVKTGVTVALFAALGSALGWTASMYAHDALMRKHRKEAKAKKRTKRAERINDMIEEQLRERNLI